MVFGWYVDRGELWKPTEKCRSSILFCGYVKIILNKAEFVYAAVFIKCVFNN